MEKTDTVARLTRIAQLVVLVAVCVFLWSDWRARRVDAERWQRLEQTLKELERTVAQASTSRPSTVSALMDREAVAQRVVGLMRAAAPASAAPCDEKAPEPEPEPKTFGPDEDTKAREAEQVVSASLASGRLRVEDVMRLRNLELASKGHPDFAGMRARVIAAINSQQLIAEDMAFVAF